MELKIDQDGCIKFTDESGNDHYFKFGKEFPKNSLGILYFIQLLIGGYDKFGISIPHYIDMDSDWKELTNARFDLISSELDELEQKAYHTGFEEGREEAREEADEKFDAGVDQGYSEGYSQGYIIGYKDGSRGSSPVYD